jgi:peptide/nickel transport system ATP-binding protein
MPDVLPMSATATTERDALLSVTDLRVTFGRGADRFDAVRGLSFHVRPGEIFGIVGESGSGKSVTSLALMGLLDARTSRITGTATLDGIDLLARRRDRRVVRGRDIAMVFQEPMTALDPVFRIGTQISETIRRHENVSRRAARARAIELLGAVGIADPTARYDAYPHEMSGGMRQRATIAIALSCGPRLLIADEPTTALDVTVQAQVLDLLGGLREERGTSIVLITHDVGVVAEICDRMITMYAGEVVETGPVGPVFRGPLHPYTAGLLAAIPDIGTRGQPLATIPGRVPGPHDVLKGCIFRGRCKYAIDACAQHPALREITPARSARCIRAEELQLRLART